MKRNGFTLIEMLIAMAIFTSLIGVLMMGFQQGLNLWGKGQKQAIRWISVEHRYEWIQRVFAQASASAYDIPNKGVWPFFIGTRKEMTFITASPIMSMNGSLRMIQFRFFDRTGRYELMYRENGSSADMRIDAAFEGSQWISLFKDLKEGQFQYEAPSNPFPLDLPKSMLPADMLQRYRENPEWISVFNANVISSLPSRVDFIFMDNEGAKHHWRFHCRYVSNIWPKEFYGESN